MLYFSRTASIAPGKASEAIAFGHLIAKYIKETYGTELVVLVPIGEIRTGSRGTLTTITSRISRR